jgi:bifunctional N-acetylglucosamine-1-phosphate-uridyltransferase/glucosamine-1-phosphate-acetyltransferase GlmU-like protein
MNSSRAKVSFNLAEKPMLQRVVDTAFALDAAKIAVVVGFQKEAVIACLEEDDRLDFVEQTEQLGTGHAVMICEESFRGLRGMSLSSAGCAALKGGDSAITLRRAREDRCLLHGFDSSFG